MQYELPFLINMGGFDGPAPSVVAHWLIFAYLGQKFNVISNLLSKLHKDVYVSMSTVYLYPEWI